MRPNMQQSSQNGGDYNLQVVVNNEKTESVSLDANIELKLPPCITDGSQLIDMQIEEISKLFGLFPMVGLWFLVGASDTGKSMILRQLALSVAGQIDFLGNQFNGKHGRALYISTEDDKMSIAFLVRKQNQTLKVSKDVLKNFLCTTDSDNLIETVRSVLEVFPVDLIVLDAFGDLFTAKDLNQNNQVRQFLQPFSDIAIKYECSVCFLHHTGKRTEELAPSKNNVIGSQAIEAKSRCVIEFRKDSSESNLRHLCIVKANYLAESEKVASYVLRMDENLCFNTTGDRVEFEMLKSGSNGGETRKVKISPSSYENKTHIQFLKDTFQSVDTIYTAGKLREQIEIRFVCSDKPAREFIKHYERKGWIKNLAKPSSSSYQYTIIPEQMKIDF